LQHGKFLDELLMALKSEQQALSQKHGKKVPMLFKVAPDLTDDEIAEMAKQFLQAEIEGLITTNTSATREGVEDDKNAQESGGLSGLPIYTKALNVQEKFHQHFGGQIPLIGVGGIMTAQQALERIEKGAQLVQLYTGFIYEGPQLIQSIVETLGKSVHFNKKGV